MTYVDGFVIAMPKKNFKAYKKMAQEGAKMWKKFGALEYFECVGNDLHPNMGGMKGLTFPKMVKAKPNEIVWFSFIVYKSKAHRDAVNKKVMKQMEEDKKKYPTDMKMPFEMNRMAYGGFKTVIQR